MAPPSRKHQILSRNLYYTITNYINVKNGEYEVYAAPFAIFLNEDDGNYIEPDISVICDKNSWMIEVAKIPLIGLLELYHQ
ncbi:hypothetical protein NDGK_02502 [Clostridiales bacterium CHKCI001]|nr:hypothetical protein NDGK_02502 [Clostridiales bacterium CHKCI001]